MIRIAQPCRPRRAGEWTEAKAVTFIVTLAASRSVTLAAARSGMSRKSAYALQRRDARFAAAWNAALEASARTRRDGDKVDEFDRREARKAKGNKPPSRRNRPFAGNRRGDSFDAIWNGIIDSLGSSLAPRAALP